ncbi:hypothetical protein [Glaciimonas sp. PCH181]|uniref:hypothetical protein n=1 Tax=Glaciimonas sp. PCH181 TaxID=2133943 RepID=UPI0011B29C3C|nr:hypothetical protein [Glaciimonas sp. PCH181]
MTASECYPTISTKHKDSRYFFTGIGWINVEEHGKPVPIFLTCVPESPQKRYTSQLSSADIKNIQCEGRAIDSSFDV